MNCIALIPARSQSKRLPHKNIKLLGAHCLLAYAIQAARDSGLFGSYILVSTDSRKYAEIAEYYGAVVTIRPPEYAEDHSPDAEWICHALDKYNQLWAFPPSFDTVAIIRPTSPFRTGDTIKRAWDMWRDNDHPYWLKAVEPVSQHPGKMWSILDCFAEPYDERYDTMHHAMPTQYLRSVYVQNASLEFRKVAYWKDTEMIVPFITEGAEGLDINTNMEYQYAKYLVANGRAKLPVVDREPYKHTTIWED